MRRKQYRYHIFCQFKAEENIFFERVYIDTNDKIKTVEDLDQLEAIFKQDMEADLAQIISWKRMRG